MGNFLIKSQFTTEEGIPKAGMKKEWCGSLRLLCLGPQWSFSPLSSRMLHCFPAKFHIGFLKMVITYKQVPMPSRAQLLLKTCWHPIPHDKLSHGGWKGNFAFPLKRNKQNKGEEWKRRQDWESPLAECWLSECSARWDYWKAPVSSILGSHFTTEFCLPSLQKTSPRMVL